ncbi:hypothetical protein, conserved [Trypanosoma brucei gambiense DAL972]|uniref:Uncharacterized protein n=3 Tax=Trypanosoma brucei TaxID=5691 RepID=Q57V62_TRYB2|nr:hypothetical protein, conserved [Trypanosoma brucei gambiense DAL972]XP_843917.1 hypothetical protein, conserved [Trypanosoma brucei brucei TREU927]AAX70524.1 hypothetical protein, conserved [Trypanosoma brucei]RHW73943.1 hypothetical protein DPX39_030031500 [Trypanosoma brucei equiperdum]AAZ10358.1 hypothetical protein, conserved [Trypanosoma brucei brucei TREU927]CBH10001.1 hypothetical protein, conserved [Trypanosoma brucei gambiense DAL972]|eukprot:XP_011772292.1 hypothetical protein, conserved [Trypanosoma brucei gambiense DAL972]
MKKSVSLKEFSTTPTVSYMLRKDGHNLAEVRGNNSNSLNGSVNGPRSPPPVFHKEEKPPQSDNNSELDVMYDME